MELRLGYCVVVVRITDLCQETTVCGNCLRVLVLSVMQIWWDGEFFFNLINLKYEYAGGVSCTSEVQRALPILKKAYGHSMQKVLHVGPDTCLVVSKLLKEEDTEAWGVEPYEIDDTDATCKSLVHKGIVRVADIKFPLPYRPKSFSVVIVSDTLDYLSPKYLNRTLPELIRVSSDGVVIFAGNSL